MFSAFSICGSIFFVSLFQNVASSLPNCSGCIMGVDSAHGLAKDRSMPIQYPQRLVEHLVLNKAGFLFGHLRNEVYILTEQGDRMLFGRVDFNLFCYL